MALFKLSEGGWNKSRTPFKSNYSGSAPGSFTDSTLAIITYGSAFSDSVAAPAPSGSRPTRYNITSGALPVGLELDTRTGAISGTSTVSESYAFTVTASNPNGSVSESYTGTTADAPVWSVNTLSDFIDSTSYSDGVSATARPAPTYSVSAGSLPPGISLNTSDGSLSGTPSGPNNAFSFTITASNPAGSVSQSFSGNIIGIVIDFLVLAGGSVGGRSDSAPYPGGGGGAGGYRTSWAGASGTELSGGASSVEDTFKPLPNTTYTVTVGGAGGSSVLGSITSLPGGGGGQGGRGVALAAGGSNGGSGGGAGKDAGGVGGTGGTGQGSDGGDALGGGGGAGEAGNTDGVGYGGDGLTSTITGSAVTRGGGGGAGNGGTYNNSGDGGGGWGRGVSGLHKGVDGYGGGGGGGDAASNGGAQSGANGGSGRVILRFDSSLSFTVSAGLTYGNTTVGGDRVLDFSSGSGTISWSL